MALMARVTKTLALALWAAMSPVHADEAPLRLATQVAGTVNWEITTIVANGFDKANGIAITVQDVDAGPAAQIALLAGEADVIVSDWLWVARQRAEGRDLVFVPYSKAVGALYLAPGSTAQSLADLKGQQIGVAGGPVDKSWLILRAYAQQVQGFDLGGETEQVFGAPPLIFESALNGEVAAAVNFWHFGAKMQAAGLRPLITVAEAAAALGLDPETPLLGYVMAGDTLRQNPALMAGLVKASRAAKDLLATDDAAWDALRPIMNAKTDAQFQALKAGFRAGIPAPGPVNTDGAAKMLAIMVALGGPELMGKVTTLPEGLFYSPAE